MVDLRQVVTYFSYGTIYAMLSDEYKLAFKKIQLDPKQDHLDLLNHLKEKVIENKVRREGEFAAVTWHIQQVGEKQTSSTNLTGKFNNTQRGNNNPISCKGNYRGRGGKGNYRASNSNNNQRGSQNGN